MPLYLGNNKIEDVEVAIQHRYTDTVTELPGGGEQHTIIADLDLSQDTVDSAHLAMGYTAHNASGQPIIGTGGCGILVANGTFTGPNTYYISVPVGTDVPTTNFIFYMWTEDQIAYSSSYKITMLSYVLPSEFGYIGSSGTVIPSITNDVNNSGTITSKEITPPLGFTYITNTSVNVTGYSVLYDRPSWKTSGGSFCFYWNRNNSTYTFPAITYKWKLIYFGPNYANEHMSLSS